ncbi:unnamed protein product [Amoebophrya sp. A25]|nr:unnamed protein product [Amoebophrya sp. A25]|eukprot:GSA25T00019990001.1
MTVNSSGRDLHTLPVKNVADEGDVLEDNQRHQNLNIFSTLLNPDRVNLSLRHYCYSDQKIHNIGGIESNAASRCAIHCRQCTKEIVGPLFHCLNFPRFTQMCCLACVLDIVKSPCDDPVLQPETDRVVLRRDHVFEPILTQLGNILDVEAKEERQREQNLAHWEELVAYVRATHLIEDHTAGASSDHMASDKQLEHKDGAGEGGGSSGKDLKRGTEKAKGEQPLCGLQNCCSASKKRRGQSVDKMKNCNETSSRRCCGLLSCSRPNIQTEEKRGPFTTPGQGEWTKCCRTKTLPPAPRRPSVKPLGCYGSLIQAAAFGCCAPLDDDPFEQKVLLSTLGSSSSEEDDDMEWGVEITEDEMNSEDNDEEEDELRHLGDEDEESSRDIADEPASSAASSSSASGSDADEEEENTSGTSDCE